MFGRLIGGPGATSRGEGDTARSRPRPAKKKLPGSPREHVGKMRKASEEQISGVERKEGVLRALCHTTPIAFR